MVIGVDRRLDFRLDLRLFHFSFGRMDVLVSYGWPSTGYGSTLSLLSFAGV